MRYPVNPFSSHSFSFLLIVCVLMVFSVSYAIIDLLLMDFKDILVRVGLSILDLVEEEVMRCTIEDLQTGF